MEKCPKCGEDFLPKNKIHIIDHNGKDLLVCPVCLEEYKKKQKK